MSNGKTEKKRQGRGRPPLSKKKALAETVSLRLREDEVKVLRKAAKEEGKSVSDLIRERLFSSSASEDGTSASDG